LGLVDAVDDATARARSATEVPAAGSELPPTREHRDRDLRVGSYIVNASGMTYIVQRQDRFYVVAYDGRDPHTGGSGVAGTRSDLTATTPRGGVRWSV